jgi:hypothetical protein
MSRPSLFEEEDIDLSGFAPKADSSVSVPPDTVRKISEEGGFPSRAARPSVSQPSAVGLPSTARQPMVYRTGRNTTFSAKTTPETVETFYQIAREQGWKAGETFERAVEALKASLA